MAFGIKFLKEALSSHELKDGFLKFHFVNLEQLEEHTFEPDDLIQKIKIIAANLCAYSGKKNPSLVKTLYQAFELLLNNAGLDERLEKKCLFIPIAQVLHFADLTANERQTLSSKYWQYYKHALGKMPSLKLLCIERLLDSNQDTLIYHTQIPQGLMEVLTLTLYESPSQYSAVGLSKLMRFNTIFKEEKPKEENLDDDVLSEPPAKLRKLY